MSSWCMRYAIRSRTVTILRPCARATSSRRGRRAIEPSLSMISQIAAAGTRPASRARSTEASVWPARLRTPPLRARSGNVCPGLSRSCGRVAGSMAACTVAARSAAEIPVVTRPRASMETQNAVWCGEVLCSTIAGSCSSSQRCSVSARQIRPRACVAMKLIASASTFSAAIARSPSFSRSSSSTTTTKRPRRNSAAASSMLAKTLPSFATSAILLLGRRGRGRRIPLDHGERDLLAARKAGLGIAQRHLELEVRPAPEPFEREHLAEHPHVAVDLDAVDRLERLLVVLLAARIEGDLQLDLRLALLVEARPHHVRTVGDALVLLVGVPKMGQQVHAAEVERFADVRLRRLADIGPPEDRRDVRAVRGRGLVLGVHGGDRDRAGVAREGEVHFPLAGFHRQRELVGAAARDAQS